MRLLIFYTDSRAPEAIDAVREITEDYYGKVRLRRGWNTQEELERDHIAKIEILDVEYHN